MSKKKENQSVPVATQEVELIEQLVDVTEQTPETEVTIPAVDTQETKPVDGSLTYIGPSLNSMLLHGTVYVGGLPEVAERAIGQFPPMRMLFVEADRLLEATKELNKEKSAMRSIYKQTTKHFTRRR